MILNVKEDAECREIEITIRCAELTESVQKLIDRIQNLDAFCECGTEENLMKANILDAYYFESVENRTFVYFEKQVHECRLKLYEVEEKYEKLGFLRISKNTIVNMYKIEKVKPTLNHKFMLVLLNGEKMIVNRHYVPSFKEKFNI